MAIPLEGKYRYLKVRAGVGARKRRGNCWANSLSIRQQRMNRENRADNAAQNQKNAG
jgi:hypothetical protein